MRHLVASFFAILFIGIIVPQNGHSHTENGLFFYPGMLNIDDIMRAEAYNAFQKKIPDNKVRKSSGKGAGGSQNTRPMTRQGVTNKPDSTKPGQPDSSGAGGGGGAGDGGDEAPNRNGSESLPYYDDIDEIAETLLSLLRASIEAEDFNQFIAYANENVERINSALRPSIIRLIQTRLSESMVRQNIIDQLPERIRPHDLLRPLGKNKKKKSKHTSSYRPSMTLSQPDTTTPGARHKTNTAFGHAGKSTGPQKKTVGTAKQPKQSAGQPSKTVTNEPGILTGIPPRHFPPKAEEALVPPVYSQEHWPGLPQPAVRNFLPAPESTRTQNISPSATQPSPSPNLTDQSREPDTTPSAYSTTTEQNRSGSTKKKASKGKKNQEQRPSGKTKPSKTRHNNSPPPEVGASQKKEKVAKKTPVGLSSLLSQEELNAVEERTRKEDKRKEQALVKKADRRQKKLRDKTLNKEGEKTPEAITKEKESGATEKSAGGENPENQSDQRRSDPELQATNQTEPPQPSITLRFNGHEQGFSSWQAMAIFLMNQNIYGGDLWLIIRDIVKYCIKNNISLPRDLENLLLMAARDSKVALKQLLASYNRGLIRHQPLSVVRTLLFLVRNSRSHSSPSVRRMGDTQPWSRYFVQQLTTTSMASGTQPIRNVGRLDEAWNGLVNSLLSQSSAFNIEWRADQCPDNESSLLLQWLIQHRELLASSSQYADPAHELIRQYWHDENFALSIRTRLNHRVTNMISSAQQPQNNTVRQEYEAMLEWLRRVQPELDPKDFIIKSLPKYLLFTLVHTLARFEATQDIARTFIALYPRSELAHVFCDRCKCPIKSIWQATHDDHLFMLCDHCQAQTKNCLKEGCDQTLQVVPDSRQITENINFNTRTLRLLSNEFRSLAALLEYSETQNSETIQPLISYLGTLNPNRHRRLITLWLRLSFFDSPTLLSVLIEILKNHPELDWILKIIEQILIDHPDWLAGDHKAHLM